MILVNVTQKFMRAVKRFPISVLFIVAFAFWFFIHVAIIPDMEYHNRIKIPNIPITFLLSCAVISAATVLWLEDFVNYIKQQIITFVTVLLWGAYCFFLHINGKIYYAEGAELVCIEIALFLSFFFISFLKKDKDKAFWNFIIQTSFQILFIAYLGIFISVGLCIVGIAIGNLFKIDILFYAWFIYFFLFAPIYFLANIPDKIAKHNEKISLNYYLKTVTLYILIPIAVIYAVILYVYLLKIIFTWELPNGSVSYLVSALAFSGLLLITLLYPARLEEKNKFIVFLCRYSGIIMLPLFALMTIGIFRRISDYGITIFRCHILLINIWFYGIYIYLFITKTKRIKFIFISFAAISLLVSIGFWSVPNITKSILTYEINSYLGDQKISVSYEDSLDNIDEKYRQKVIDKIKYLHKKYEIKNVQQFFSDDVNENYFNNNKNFRTYYYKR